MNPRALARNHARDRSLDHELEHDHEYEIVVAWHDWTLRRVAAHTVPTAIWRVAVRDDRRYLNPNINSRRSYRFRKSCYAARICGGAAEFKYEALLMPRLAHGCDVREA